MIFLVLVILIATILAVMAAYDIIKCLERIADALEKEAWGK